MDKLLRIKEEVENLNHQEPKSFADWINQQPAIIKKNLPRLLGITPSALSLIKNKKRRITASLLMRMAIISKTSAQKLRRDLNIEMSFFEIEALNSFDETYSELFNKQTNQNEKYQNQEN